MKKRYKILLNFLLSVTVVMLVVALIVIGVITSYKFQKILHPSKEHAVSYEELIPDPGDFFTGDAKTNDISTEQGAGIVVTVWNCDQPSFDRYVLACQYKGFDDISYNTAKAFYAYTSDGNYAVQVDLDINNQVRIACVNAKKGDESKG